MPIDWSHAAWLTAKGVRTSEILEAVGCSRSQLRRRQKQCRLFRALVGQLQKELARTADESGPSEPDDLSLDQVVRTQLEQEISNGNIKVALWLAERLRLFAPDPDEGTDETLRRLLESMTPDERSAFTRPD